MDYLPEWKIYLWKKLLLNTEGFDRGTVVPHNFVFFSDDEQFALMSQGTQRMIDSIQHAYGTALARREAMKVDTAAHQSIDDSYYSCHPIKVLSALVELMDSKPRVLNIEASLSKSYIALYWQARKTYETSQQRKNLASISMGGGRVEPNPTYMNDPFCELGETIYKKTKEGEVLTADEFRELAGVAHSRAHEHLILKLQIDKPALQARLDAYLDDFVAGNLVAPHGVQYFDPSLQIRNIFGAIKAMTASFGSKNLQVTPERISQYGKWAVGDEKHYRIFESIFFLEKSGELTVSDLRQSEFVLSLAPIAAPAVASQPVKKVPEHVVELKPEMEVGGLVAYSDGSIRSKGKMVEMRSQIKVLCRLFMRNPDRLLTHDDIRTEIVDSSKRGSTPYGTIAKYVSELRRALKVHFGNDVITNQNKDGWVFSVKKM